MRKKIKAVLVITLISLVPTVFTCAFFSAIYNFFVLPPLLIFIGIITAFTAFLSSLFAYKLGYTDRCIEEKEEKEGN